MNFQAAYHIQKLHKMDVIFVNQNFHFSGQKKQHGISLF